MAEDESKTTRCKYCGTENKAYSHFCIKCGKPLDEVGEMGTKEERPSIPVLNIVILAILAVVIIVVAIVFLLPLLMNKPDGKDEIIAATESSQDPGAYVDSTDTSDVSVEAMTDTSDVPAETYTVYTVPGVRPRVPDPSEAAMYAAVLAQSEYEFYNPDNGHAYLLVNYNNINAYSVHSWEKWCEAQGGYLAIIDDRAENDFLYNSLRSCYNPETGKNMESAYFGYTDEDDEGRWYWFYDNETGFTNWHAGQPNNSTGNENCACFYYKFADGSWNDSEIGNNSYWFFCEWEPDGSLE